MYYQQRMSNPETGAMFDRLAQLVRDSRARSYAPVAPPSVEGFEDVFVQVLALMRSRSLAKRWTSA